MARIQILELPDEEGDDGKTVTPFALIIDQCEYPDGVMSRAELDAINESFRQFARECGARASLAASATIEVPGLTAEQVATINGPHVGTAAIEIVPDFTGFESAIRETVEAIGPQKVGVYVGKEEISDIVRAELAENNRGIVDALSDGRG
ncbi:hypothetical protein OG216_09695 [Streptomycetaceae bacterium NBC_01309]